MFCPSCGAQLPDGSKFCTSCGSPLATPVPGHVPVDATSAMPVPSGPVPSQTPAEAEIDSFLREYGAQEPSPQPGFGAQEPSPQPSFGQPQGFGTDKPQDFGASQPGFGAPQSFSAGQQQPGFGSQQPGFGTDQPQGFGIGGAQQPSFGADQQPQPGFGAGQQPQPGFGTGQQPQPGFGAGQTQRPSYTNPQAPGGTPAGGSTGPKRMKPAQGGGKKPVVPIVVAAIVVIAVVAGILTKGFGLLGGGIGKPPVRETLEEYSWSELSAISQEIAAADDLDAAIEIAASYNLCDEDGELDLENTKDVELSDGTVAPVAIVGIYQDEAADGGQAGLTFMFMGCVSAQPFNSDGKTDGGWEDSDLRDWLNDDFIDMLPSDLSGALVECVKLTNNTGKTEDEGEVTETEDLVWAPSLIELGGPTPDWAYTNVYDEEGEWYQAFEQVGVQYNSSSNVPELMLNWLLEDNEEEMLTQDEPCTFWERSPYPGDDYAVNTCDETGNPDGGFASADLLWGVAPMFAL